jgi:hypothetical protein
LRASSAQLRSVRYRARAPKATNLARFAIGHSENHVDCALDECVGGTRGAVWNKCPGTSDENKYARRQRRKPDPHNRCGASRPCIVGRVEPPRLEASAHRSASSRRQHLACLRGSCPNHGGAGTSRRDAGLADGGAESTHLSYSRPRSTAPDYRFLKHSEPVPIHADDSAEPGRAVPAAAPRRHGLQSNEAVRASPLCLIGAADAQAQINGSTRSSGLSAVTECIAG